MVRRICPNCRTAFVPTTQEQEIFTREMSRELPAVYKGTGCHLCGNTGYRGRTGIFEMLVISDGIKKLLVNNGSVSDIKNLAVSEGMLTMKRDGLVKVQEGITTLEEVTHNIFGAD
jgi:type IV pilus assembly protein PilB